MSVESTIRAALVAHGPLVAIVPAARIGVDAVPQGSARPWISIIKPAVAEELGLDNTDLGTITTVDVQCIGSDRANAIVVADLVRAALRAAAMPASRGGAAYDPENGLEVELVTVDWLDA